MQTRPLLGCAFFAVLKYFSEREVYILSSTNESARAILNVYNYLLRYNGRNLGLDLKGIEVLSCAAKRTLLS